MAITEAYVRDGVTVGGTEYSITNNSTTLGAVTDDGVYQLWAGDGGNMTKTEEYRFRIYEKVEGSGGPQKVVFSATIKGVQQELFVTPMLILIHGWEMSAQKLAGTDRAFDFSIRKIA